MAVDEAIPSALTARRVQQGALPIVDIGAIGQGGAAERDAASRLREACLDKGFLYLRDHGISSALIETVLGQARTFFGTPLEEKLRIHLRASPTSRGYEPMKTQIRSSFRDSRSESPEPINVSVGTLPTSWSAAAFRRVAFAPRNDRREVAGRRPVEAGAGHWHDACFAGMMRSIRRNRWPDDASFREPPPARPV